LSALAEFLRIDADLMRAAAERAPANDLDAQSLEMWIKSLPAADKDRWLIRAATRPDLALGTEMVAAYRRANVPSHGGAGRTVAQIRDRAGEISVARERGEAIAQEKARAKAAAASQKRLDALEREGDKSWDYLDKLVDRKAYTEAVSLTVDLRDLAARAGTLATFEARLVGVRKRHLRRRGYLDTVKVALRRRQDDDT
jgi:hypothetical protein